MKQSVIGFFLWTILLVACSPQQQPTGNLPEPTAERTCAQTGCLAPNFKLKTSTGGDVELRSLKGSSVFINFWATWCGYCVSEMTDIQALFDTYYPEGLIVLGINQEESDSEVLQFAKDYGLTFILLLDSNGKIYQEYQVTALPTSFFIDQNGVIQNIIIGSMDRDDMERIIVSSLSMDNIGHTATNDEILLKGCVNTSSLRIRSGPGENYSVIGGLVNGDCREFNGRNGENSWLRIYPETDESNADTYWVSSQYINLRGDIETLPIVP